MKKKWKEILCDIEEDKSATVVLIERMKDSIDYLEEKFKSIDAELRLMRQVISNDTATRTKNLIDVLLTNNFEKDDNGDFSCVAIFPYRGEPYLVKDGKKINLSNMKNITISYDKADRNIELTLDNY